jgi:hypothetical protein
MNGPRSRVELVGGGAMAKVVLGMTISLLEQELELDSQQVGS